MYLISSVEKTHSVHWAPCQLIFVSGSWWQVLFISDGAKEMTSRPCREWKRSPDRTVMTKEFLGNIRVNRGPGKKSIWRLCFLSSCSSQLPLLAHQPFSDVWNSPLTCVPFFYSECRACGRGRKSSKLAVTERVEDESLCWLDPAQHLYFTCRFSAYTWTCALVLFQSYLICMYALFISLLAIDNRK